MAAEQTHGENQSERGKTRHQICTYQYRYSITELQLECHDACQGCPIQKDVNRQAKSLHVGIILEIHHSGLGINEYLIEAAGDADDIPSVHHHMKRGRGVKLTERRHSMGVTVTESSTVSVTSFRTGHHFNDKSCLRNNCVRDFLILFPSRKNHQYKSSWIPVTSTIAVRLMISHLD